MKYSARSEKNRSRLQARRGERIVINTLNYPWCHKRGIAYKPMIFAFSDLAGVFPHGASGALRELLQRVGKIMKGRSQGLGRWFWRGKLRDQVGGRLSADSRIQSLLLGEDPAKNKYRYQEEDEDHKSY
jgi:hypothetical protein